MGCSRSVGLVGVRTSPIFVFVALSAFACGKADPGSSMNASSAGAAGSAEVVAAAGAPSTGGSRATAGAGPVLASGGSDESSTGGAASSEGGQSAGGAASAGAGGMGNTSQTVLTPGTCGIARRIRVPSINPGPPIRREAGGFVSGPWYGTAQPDGSLPIDWLVIDESGEKQTRFKAAPKGISGVNIINFGAPNQVVAFLSSTLGSGPADFWSRVVREGTTELPDFTTLLKLSAFSQRFGFVGAAPALDGQRALFVAGSDSELTLVLVAADGSAVGSTHALTTAATYSVCQSIQPTENAAALAVLEPASVDFDVFHRLELSATGEVAWEVTLPLHRARPPGWNSSALPCPMLALTPTGFALVAFETAADHDAWHLHRIDRDGTTSDELWEALFDFPLGFAIRGSIAFAVTTRSDAPLTIVKRSNGQDQTFAVDAHTTVAGTDGPFPSEAGSLFLDVRPSGEAGQIVELSCP